MSLHIFFYWVICSVQGLNSKPFASLQNFSNFKQPRKISFSSFPSLSPFWPESAQWPGRPSSLSPFSFSPRGPAQSAPFPLPFLLFTPAQRPCAAHWPERPSQQAAAPSPASSLSLSLTPDPACHLFPSPSFLSRSDADGGKLKPAPAVVSTPRLAPTPWPRPRIRLRPPPFLFAPRFPFLALARAVRDANSDRIRARTFLAAPPFLFPSASLGVRAI